MNTTYHKKEITIAGETITAEYFESSFNYSPTERNKLSDLWDTITLPFYRLKRKIRDIYWEIRYGFQRMFKDYDNVDIFSMDSKFIERYYKILTDFKKSLHGHPGRMSEEEWNKILDQMIFHLYYMDEEHIDEELCKDVPESWIPTWNTSGEIMEKHKNEFFKLFSEHFYDLWD
jgi:hypothetical protein